MALKTELEELKKYIGTDNSNFDKKLKLIRAKYNSPADLKVIDQFIRTGLESLTADLRLFNEEMTMRAKLSEVIEILPLAYIARNYFNKTKHWLYQKMNGNIVNGKPAKFNKKELEVLQFALKDISKKIGSVSISS